MLTLLYFNTSNINNINTIMTSKTAFELLPEDLQGHIASTLDFVDVLNLQESSINFRHVRSHIRHISIAYRRVDAEKLYILISKRLKTFNLINIQTNSDMLIKLTPFAETFFDTDMQEMLMQRLDSEVHGMMVVMSRLPDTLHKLNISSDRLCGDNMVHLAQYIPKHLKKLKISIKSLNTAAIKHLVKHLPKTLHTFDMSHNVFFNDFGSDLPSSTIEHLVQHLPESLRILHLKGNEYINSSTWSYLPKQLQELHVESNHIDLSNCEQLIRHLPQSLHTLNLRNNLLDIHDIVTLASLVPKTLRTIMYRGSIYEPHVNNAQEQVRKINPRLMIIN